MWLPKVVALVGFPLMAAGMIVLVVVFWDQIVPVFTSVERFRVWVQSRGVIAPLVFVAAQCLQVVVFFIPGEVPQIAGGYLFGFWAGTLLSVAGILLGSAISFLLARLLGVPFVRILFGREKVDQVLRLAGTGRARFVLFLVFLIPGIPKDVFCYAAGLTSIGLPAFILISIPARLPGIVGSALMGKAAAQQRWVLAGTILLLSVILFVLGWLFRHRLQAALERLSARGWGPWRSRRDRQRSKRDRQRPRRG